MVRRSILLANDDGVDAAGLVALRQALEPLAEIWVVAPDRERSAISHAISLHAPLRVRQHAERCFAVDGTPADCVYLALHHLLPRRPDLMVSGINHGPNLGNDVLYSGTVAGAMEAAMYGTSAFAISLAVDYGAAGGGALDFAAAAEVAAGLARALLDRPVPPGVILNVNVPARPRAELGGAKLCRLGYTNWADHVTERHDPRGRPYLWIGGDRLGHDDIADSDNNAVAAGHVSVTPIAFDVTDARAFGFVRGLTIDGFARVADGLPDGLLPYPPHPKR